MAEPRARAHLRQDVGRVGHALESAGDDHVLRPHMQRLVGHHHGLHAGAAHLVDGRARHAVGEAAVAGRLTRRRLAQAGRQHATHQHFGDLVGRDPGPAQRRLDGNGAEFGRRHRLEDALEAAHGRTRAGDDDDGIGIGVGHFGLLVHGDEELAVSIQPAPSGSMARVWQQAGHACFAFSPFLRGEGRDEGRRHTQTLASGAAPPPSPLPASAGRGDYQASPQPRRPQVAGVGPAADAAVGDRAPGAGTGRPDDDPAGIRRNAANFPVLGARPRADTQRIARASLP